MTYLKLYSIAVHKLETDQITLGEYEKMIEPLNREIRQWIPVTEKLPETNDDVLVYDGADMFVAYYQIKGMWQGWKSTDNAFDRDTPIIAWMPLPKPYEEK